MCLGYMVNLRRATVEALWIIECVYDTVLLLIGMQMQSLFAKCHMKGGG